MQVIFPVFFNLELFVPRQDICNKNFCEKGYRFGFNILKKDVVVFGGYQNQPSTKDVANRLKSKMLKNAPAIDFVEDMPFM